MLWLRSILKWFLSIFSRKPYKHKLTIRPAKGEPITIISESDIPTRRCPRRGHGR